VNKKEVECAFILMTTETGSESEVLHSLSKVEGVKEAYSVYGVYDVVAKIEARSISELKDIVTLKIRRLSAVRNTLAIIVIE